MSQQELSSELYLYSFHDTSLKFSTEHYVDDPSELQIDIHMIPFSLQNKKPQHFVVEERGNLHCYLQIGVGEDVILCVTWPEMLEPELVPWVMECAWKCAKSGGNGWKKIVNQISVAVIKQRMMMDVNDVLEEESQMPRGSLTDSLIPSDENKSRDYRMKRNSMKNEKKGWRSFISLNPDVIAYMITPNILPAPDLVSSVTKTQYSRGFGKKIQQSLDNRYGQQQAFYDHFNPAISKYFLPSITSESISYWTSIFWRIILHFFIRLFHITTVFLILVWAIILIKAPESSRKSHGIFGHQGLLAGIIVINSIEALVLTIVFFIMILQFISLRSHHTVQRYLFMADLLNHYNFSMLNICYNVQIVQSVLYMSFISSSKIVKKLMEVFRTVFEYQSIGMISFSIVYSTLAFVGLYTFIMLPIVFLSLYICLSFAILLFKFMLLQELNITMDLDQWNWILWFAFFNLVYEIKNSGNVGNSSNKIIRKATLKFFQYQTRRFEKACDSIQENLYQITEGFIEKSFFMLVLWPISLAKYLWQTFLYFLAYHNHQFFSPPFEQLKLRIVKRGFFIRKIWCIIFFDALNWEYVSEIGSILKDIETQHIVHEHSIVSPLNEMG